MQAANEKQTIDYLEQKVDFLQLLLSIHTYKLKILSYTLDNLEYENKLCLRKAQITKEIYRKVNPNTIRLVHKTLKELEQREVIKKVGADWIITSNFINNYKEEAKFIMTNVLIAKQHNLNKKKKHKQKYNNEIK